MISNRGDLGRKKMKQSSVVGVTEEDNNARLKPEPFTVIEVDDGLIRDWRSFLCKKYIKNCPFPTRLLKELKVEAEHPRLAIHRKMYNAAWVSTTLRGRRSNRNPVPEMEPNEFVHPSRAYEDVRDEWLNKPYEITRKYNIINSEKVHTEVVRKIYSANQLHTDWSLVLPCGNTEMSFINAPSTHEDTYHPNICLDNGEHRIECTDPKEYSLHVWRELCDPSRLNYKEKPEIVAMDVKAPKMRFYRKRCDEALSQLQTSKFFFPPHEKSESVKIVEEEEKKEKGGKTDCGGRHALKLAPTIKRRQLKEEKRGNIAP
ncbi:hypothetical protein ANN_19104 [Periplaneta americana]|uniref:Uncharacterized protein n=1 Tax=Periplaneta americana TaxID=6978 RepID=A0ABQ8S9E6_PERAM|nr:hypothetical protein ANN_19104 [Periplaneta americana]